MWIREDEKEQYKKLQEKTEITPDNFVIESKAPLLRPCYFRRQYLLGEVHAIQSFSQHQQEK
ncbi:MAG: hypothetical protein ACL7BU_16345 [Candidatus Phlomobacter fragariae]